MGRRLLRILYAMIRDGKTFERGPARDRTAAANRARLGKKETSRLTPETKNSLTFGGIFAASRLGERAPPDR